MVSTIIIFSSPPNLEPTTKPGSNERTLANAMPHSTSLKNKRKKVAQRTKSKPYPSASPSPSGESPIELPAHTGNRITISCDEHRTPLTTLPTNQPPFSKNPSFPQIEGGITAQHGCKVREVTRVSSTDVTTSVRLRGDRFPSK